MKTYKTYIFDMDATLTDTGPTWLGIFRDGLADFGIKDLSDKKIAAHTHDWKEFIGLGIPEAELQAFIEAAYARANERLPLAPLYDGAEAMLQKLKSAGKQIAIFTSTDRPILEPVIERYKFDELFDAVVAGNDVEHRKPHPAGIVAALQKVGINKPEPGTAVYIGDKDTDILCGQNAGIDTVLYYPSDHELLYNREALLASGPTYTIKHWRELTA